MKFPGVDPKLSPEMRSTGEVMGIGEDFGTAFYKAQLAAGLRLPSSGSILFSVNDLDKRNALTVARKFAAMGFYDSGNFGNGFFLARYGSGSRKRRQGERGTAEFCGRH